MASKIPASEIIMSSPATVALEQEQRKMTVARDGGASFEAKLSCCLHSLNFDDSLDAFPVIEWDCNEDSDSDSVRSLDTWNSIFSNDFGSSGSLGKRGRGDSRRRLVRSKKIKSDLSSLAVSFSARSA
jgi:hypothetical protein